MRVSSTSIAFTRRGLLAAIAAAGALGGRALASPQGSATGANRTHPRNMQRAELADWAALVGERFSVAGGASVRLVTVEPLRLTGRHAAPAGRSQSFSAVFEAVGPGAPEGDQTYWLSHAAVAPLPLYFGPRTRAGGRNRLVAVFS